MASPYLELKDGAGVKRVSLDRAPLTIGRNFTNMVVLEEPLASRFHAVIEKTSGGYRVRDLDSRNGTRVNGEIVKSSALAEGDVMSIGNTELRLVVPDGSEQHAATPSRGTPASQGRGVPSGRAAAAHSAATTDDDFWPAEQPATAAAAAPARGPAEPPPSIEAGDDDWERVLRDRANSLPDQSFTEGDIALVNARGVVAHAPRATAPGHKSAPTDTVQLMRLILLICFRSRASDIHLEPKNDGALVRARVDGTMVDLIKLGKEMGVKLSSVVKILSEIDISQRNSIQEGRFTSRVPGGDRQAGGPRRVDYRVSFAPAIFGQKCVIRILDAANAPLHLSDLKLPQNVMDPIRKTMQQQAGMILVCGPTGSGKSTTLYSVIRDIDATQRNVVTIEDPVEVNVEGITQIPVNEAQGNTFGSLLRSILRQDPDVILVGEIRDADTARVAMQAAMTGHLVFSTVHSRDTVGAIYRLIDLGVEPYLVASGLNLVIAQRLVRQLCPYCKIGHRPTADEVKRLATYKLAPPPQIFGPQGCRRCLNTGFMGRRGVVELLNTTGDLRDVILKSPTIQDIQAAVTDKDYVRLQQTGYQLVAEGVTSFEEVERAVA